MIRGVSIIMILFMLQGCAPKAPDHMWKFYSTSYYNAYRDYLLKGSEDRAYNSLKKSIRYAKSGADLETLKKVYLAKCALNLALLEKSTCASYAEIAELDKSEALEEYYHFLLNQEVKNIDLLPPQYRDFKREPTPKRLEGIASIVSRSVAASLIKEQLTIEQIDALIAEQSRYGYKKLVVAWMEYAMLKDKTKATYYQKKIDILKSKE
jgi:hypothetical protein